MLVFHAHKTHSNVLVQPDSFMWLPRLQVLLADEDAGVACSIPRPHARRWVSTVTMLQRIQLAVTPHDVRMFLKYYMPRQSQSDNSALKFHTDKAGDPAEESNGNAD
eukprot:3619198-Amphidinium_carterae.2